MKLAKVEEAKEIPPIKVLDEPQVPERKSSPHRSIIVIIVTLLAVFAGTVWVVSRKLWEMCGANLVKSVGSSIYSSEWERKF